MSIKDTTTTTKVNSLRLLELDALRGIAAISVVIYHFCYRYPELYGGNQFNLAFLGKYGVPFFFIISGFVIFWTLDRLKKPVDFIVSRFSRLYPIYWICLTITFLTVTIYGLEDREQSLTTFAFKIS